MAEKQPLRSEGEQLHEVLDELQREHAVKEISGWETGFPNLSRALDGIRPGLYLLIGPPGCGKTSFAKQLLDQVALHNGVAGIFFSFVERKKELRIKTLSRLSGLENKEIRRGSAYLLHWYGVPKARHADSEGMAPGWKKLKKSAEEAKAWLDLIYLVECHRGTKMAHIEDQVRAVQTVRRTQQAMVVIDDCQRLGAIDHPVDSRAQLIAEQLQQAAADLHIPILAVWPNLAEQRGGLPQIWSERASSADVVIVLEIDAERPRKLTEPNQAVSLHVVKNRDGEKGKLAYDFFPAFSKLSETSEI